LFKGYRSGRMMLNVHMLLNCHSMIEVVT